MPPYGVGALLSSIFLCAYARSAWVLGPPATYVLSVAGLVLAAICHASANAEAFAEAEAASAAACG